MQDNENFFLEDIANTMPCIDVNENIFDQISRFTEQDWKPYEDIIETFIDSCKEGVETFIK